MPCRLRESRLLALSGRQLMQPLKEKYTIQSIVGPNLDGPPAPHSIHLMGFSVGGTFTYYAASRLNDVIASIAPNAASPMIGHGEAPLEARV